MDGVLMSLHVVPEAPLGPPGVELWVVVDLLDQVEVAPDAGVVFQHVQNEVLLDGLLHGVAVEGQVLHGPVGLGRGVPEEFQGLVFWRRREGEVAGVGQHLTALDDAVDLVLEGVFVLPGLVSQGCVHIGRAPASLAGVGFVDDDGELPVQVLLGHGFGDKGKLLDGGDDDPLALGDELPQVGGALRVPHGGVHLGELPDGLADLVVQDHPVGDDDGGVEDVLSVLLQADELAGQPGDGVGLAAAG